MKKLVTVFLALAMILAMSIPAFAAENETFTLTITGTSGHTYNIYQIFTGDISQEGDKTVLSNIKYGENHYPVNGVPGTSVPTKDVEDLINAQDPLGILNAGIRGTAKYPNLNADGTAASIVVENVPAGYYMIVDVTEDLPDGQTLSPIILQMVETVTIASKHATISSTKQVYDKNDSTVEEGTAAWQDSADHDIGDHVPFRLTVDLPATFTTYEDYTLTFHDLQAPGFGMPQNLKVYILQKNGDKIENIVEKTATTSGYTLYDHCTNQEKCEFHGCTFNIEVGDIHDFYTNNKEFKIGDKLIVEYTSELLPSANVGSLGNENGMYVCHPDGHTPQDFVTVFTYELKVNKIDGANAQPLAGASFTLSKWIATGEGGSWVALDTMVLGANQATFTWSGIDGGKYKLEETTTPTGYNTIAPMEFTVDSNHKAEWVKGYNSAFMDLIAKDAAGNVVFGDGVLGEGGATVEDGKLEGTLANYKGAVLPETGAEGTFFLITGGTLLVILAAVFMITRKKMSIYED